MLAPFLVYFSLPSLILGLSRELVPTAEILEVHNSNPNSLIGLAYSNPVEHLKFHSSLFRKADVLVLGTSRTMQFRSFFFKENVNFYNAGGGVERLKQFLYFIREFQPENQPKILLIGLDQFMFNKKFDPLADKNYSIDYKDKYSLINYVFGSGFQVWKDVFNKKINWDSLQTSKFERYGMNAIQNDNGFRSDGSYRYGQTINYPEKAEDYQFKDTYKRIKDGNRRFEYADSLNPDALVVIHDILMECQKRKISLVAFLPPYAPSILRKMEETKKYYYLNQIKPALEPIFSKYNFPLFDFTSKIKDSTPLNDSSFIDGFHGSEVVYLQLMNVIAHNTKTFEPYCDTTILNSLEKRAGKLQVFEESFSNRLKK